MHLAELSWIALCADSNEWNGDNIINDDDDESGSKQHPAFQTSSTECASEL